jgi:hypothetical protein
MVGNLAGEAVGEADRVRGGQGALKAAFSLAISTA